MNYDIPNCGSNVLCVKMNTEIPTLINVPTGKI